LKKTQTGEDMINIIPQPKTFKTDENIKFKQNHRNLIKTNSPIMFSLVENTYIRTLEEDKSFYFYMVISEKAITNINIPALPGMIENEKEGYFLEIDINYTIIASQTEQGLFYGWQTYLQLQQQEIDYYILVIDFPDNEFRGFHMDLRYGMPKFERILQIIDRLANYKYNKFILEYENRFPFQKYPQITDKLSLTPDEIKIINEYCSERFIGLIPLQQTIGHLEYLLKLDEFNQHREVKDFPETLIPFSFNSVGFKFFNEIDEICASDKKAYELVESMLIEIINSHPGSQYIHIGCDEAWNLISCNNCKNNFGLYGRADLYIKHINQMAKIVIEHGKIPIIWDDMLRTFDDEMLKKVNSDVVIMCWLYYESNRNLAKKLIKKYNDSGFQVIGASAAKCSEGPEPQYLDLPWYRQRVDNVFMWADLCDEFDLQGSVITVWSNYSGTIAPPHPFFDTVWYPVICSAQFMWNNNINKSGFEELFLENFFGVNGIKNLFNNNNQKTYTGFLEIVKECKKNSYEAKVMEIMSLVSAYRIKSQAINRELYRLNTNITEAERRIVFNRLKEVKNLREYLKPQIAELLNIYYYQDDIDIFINSKFETDEILYKNYV